MGWGNKLQKSQVVVGGRAERGREDMAESSSMIERWKVCTLVSFTGCIILLLCLNQSKSSADLLRLHQKPSPISLLHFSTPTPPSMIMNPGRPQNKSQDQDGCNIFDGHWVYGPKLATPPYHCPFLSDQVSCRRNGRSDSDYEKWRWTAKHCQIPRFNATDMMERLRGKRVIIVGDSLNRNQWESLACLLYSALPPSRAYVETQSSLYKVFGAKDYDCSVEFYWSPFLVQLDVLKQNGTRVLRLDKLSDSARRWRGADVMVFNTGHWWAHQGKLRAWDLFEYQGKLMGEMKIEAALSIAMKTWAGWVKREVVDRNKTRVFFRSISPSHTVKQCCNESQPMSQWGADDLSSSSSSSFPLSLKHIIERTIKEMGTGNPPAVVRYLNITALSQYRRDAHPSIYARKLYPDCSHWCLPGVPDTWNTLLYASLLSDTFGHISDS